LCHPRLLKHPARNNRPEPENKRIDLLNTANLSFHLAGSVKMYSLLMFYQYEKKFGKAYLKIEKLLRSRGDKSA
jgi:hypothetical protein